MIKCVSLNSSENALDSKIDIEIGEFVFFWGRVLGEFCNVVCDLFVFEIRIQNKSFCHVVWPYKNE